MQTNSSVVGLGVENNFRNEMAESVSLEIEEEKKIIVTVERLGPDYVIQPGVFYDLFYGKAIATHAGLVGGRIMAASLDLPKNHSTSRRFYAVRPEGMRFAFFSYHCSKMRGYDYSHIQWKRELEGDEAVVTLISPKTIP